MTFLSQRPAADDSKKEFVRCRSALCMFPIIILCITETQTGIEPPELCRGEIYENLTENYRKSKNRTKINENCSNSAGNRLN